MFKKYKDIIRDIVIIFFLSLTPLLWFRSDMVMAGHDLVAPLDPKVFFTGRLSPWIDQFYGQSQVLILGTIPIHFIDAIPSYLGLSLQAGQKLVYIFWFFLIGLSAYTLAHVLNSKSSIFKITASLLYQFNFFILQGWWIAEKSKFSAYIAAPLVLSVFLLVEKGNVSLLSGVVLNSFVLFLFNAGGLFGLPLYGGFFVIIGSFILFSVTENLFKKNFTAVKKILWLTALTIVLGGMMNAYAFLPAMMQLRSQVGQGIAAIGGVSGIISWAGEISANASLLNLMRLEGIAEWYDNPEHPYAKFFLSNPILIAVSFLWAILSFASLYFVREKEAKRKILYFFFLYLIGIFFAAGTHPPLGFLYQMLVEKVPGFFIFRSPYFKFASGLFLANAILLAYVMDALPKRIRLGLTSVFLAIVLLYHFPFFMGNFFEWRKGFSTRLAVPPYVFEFGAWLNGKKDIGRILMLPPDSPDLQYSLYTWGYLSFQALPTLLSNASVVIDNDKLNSPERILTLELYNAILEGNSQKVAQLTSLLGITHVVIQNDTAIPDISSIPTEIKLYSQGIIKTGLFEEEKIFDQWEVFRRKKEGPGNFYTVGYPSLVDGSVEDNGAYVNQPDLADAFIFKSENVNTNVLAFGQTIIVPQCLTCPRKNKPEVVFPERNILPGDPLYAVILLSEQLRARPTDPRGIIYNTLGISLKRVSEINQMMFEKRPLTKVITDRYISLLQTIKTNFENLPTFEEKITVARDTQQYLRAERNFLRPNLGSSVTAGSQTVLAGSIFSALSEVEAILDPYIAPLEDQNSRLYQFNLSDDNTFGVYLRSADIKEYARNKSTFLLTIDNSVVREVNLDTAMQEEWLPFGTVRVGKGFHTVKLSLPPTVEMAYPLTPIETEFSSKGENSCFGTTVSPLVHDKLYRMWLRYLNDFSDNLILFAWEHQPDGTQRLISAVKLLEGPFEEKQEQIVEVSSGVTQITLALCAPNLTIERAEKQFNLSISEIIYPAIIFTSTTNKPSATESVGYTRYSPTRYEVTLGQNVSYPMLLVFPQRFDPWWQIKGVDARHITVNGYANGWIIERPTSSPLIVEYKGREYFRLGLIITAISILLGLVIVRKRKGK